MKFGLRQKTMIGFLGLILLLLFSSSVSFLELRRIGLQTQNILLVSNQSLTLSREMFDAAGNQRYALQQMFMAGNEDYDSLYSISQNQLVNALDNAKRAELTGIDSIQAAFTNYMDVAQYYRTRVAINDDEWFNNEYTNAYMRLTESIKEYMTTSQNAIGPQALAIEHNAYRAITPSIITLGVIMLIVLMLWYFLYIYGIKTIVNLNRALRDYLKYGIPFNVKVEGQDETLELRDNIAELTVRAEDVKKERETQSK